MQKAFITGITGQDGSYLAELLLEKDYDVYGLIRRTSLFNRDRIEHIIRGNKQDKFKLVYGDLSDSSSLNRLLEKIKPNEIYNLGAQSHVAISFEVPEFTSDVNGLGALRLLDAIRETGIDTRIYQASSSELYGKVVEKPQTESTKFYPRSPYACAKAYAYYITQNYREAYNIFACNGILFNHESPRRGENFVTRKITLSFARIKYGLQQTLYLGNLDAKRDWGYAPDYVRAMWLILQHNKPNDYVIATGKTYSVRYFVEKVAKENGYDFKWQGKDENECGIDVQSGEILVKINPKYYRPTDVDYLCGNAELAKKELSWEPEVDIDELIKIMVEADNLLAKKQLLIKEQFE